MTRRALLLPLLLAAHLAVLAVALRPAATAAERPGGSTITVAEIPSAVAPPVVAPALVETVVAVEVEAPLVDAPSAVPAVGPARGDCALTDDIQSALRSDGATAAALSQVPAASRSVANALMIWDGRWGDGNSALAPIQRIVVASIRAASPECQAAAITGPRLIMVPDGKGSAVLAFGSGVWSWAQLLA
ncbi:hypothetical protein [Glacieibacterium sp.]|uniref:hypothetical protein n=1 Tax=Glacieibacterium sp. TaxID=2860237 RepID=UPI003AFFCE6F